jgi:hypothetical protein
MARIDLLCWQNITQCNQLRLRVTLDHFSVPLAYMTASYNREFDFLIFHITFVTMWFDKFCGTTKSCTK